MSVAYTLEAIAVPPTPPTDAELDVLIRARLAMVGIDIDQLPRAHSRIR